MIPATIGICSLYCLEIFILFVLNKMLSYLIRLSIHLNNINHSAGQAVARLSLEQKIQGSNLVPVIRMLVQKKLCYPGAMMRSYRLRQHVTRISEWCNTTSKL